MTLLAATSIAIGIVLVAFGIYVLLAIYLLSSRGDKAMARIYNCPRRHLESVFAWRKRMDAVSKKVSETSDAFIAEARKNGNRVEEGRRITFTLPAYHPLSVAHLCARYPDGPSYEELKEYLCPESQPETSNAAITDKTLN